VLERGQNLWRNRKGWSEGEQRRVFSQSSGTRARNKATFFVMKEGRRKFCPEKRGRKPSRNETKGVYGLEGSDLKGGKGNHPFLPKKSWW